VIPFLIAPSLQSGTVCQCSFSNQNEPGE